MAEVQGIKLHRGPSFHKIRSLTISAGVMFMTQVRQKRKIPCLLGPANNAPYGA